MVEQVKPEVHLEVCSGFFRIPTETVNYNITVLNTSESTAAAVVNQIIETESKVQRAPNVKEPPVVDNFYLEAVSQFSKEFSRLTEKGHDAKGSSVAAGDFSNDPAIARLYGIAGSAAAVEQGLSELRDNVVAQSEMSTEKADVGDEESGIINGIKKVCGEVERVKELLAEIRTPQDSSAPPPAPVSTPTTKTRYLFDIDVVFQTMYELCTNETVKTHSQEARAKADTLFDKDIFLDYLSERVSGYEEDDNFLSVPIDDVLTGLINSCEDKGVINLFRNMNKKQADIFLDQFLPLEVPAKEDIVSDGESSVSSEEAETPLDAGGSALNLEKLADISELLAKISTDLEQMTGKESSPKSSGDELLPKIDDLLGQAKGLNPDLKEIASDLTETFSAAGGQGKDQDSMLLAEMIHLGQGLVRSLKEKEANAGLVFSKFESSEKVAADNAVLDEDGLGKNEVVGLPDPFDEELSDDDDDDDDDFGEASQDDIDKLLADMA